MVLLLAATAGIHVTLTSKNARRRENALIPMFCLIFDICSMLFMVSCLYRLYVSSLSWYNVSVSAQRGPEEASARATYLLDAMH